MVLDFQLREHERFLSKFNAEFRQVDKDGDGVINEIEFKRLLERMGVLANTKDTEYLLHEGDPNNNQKMTFSSIVALLSSNLIERESDSS